MAWPSRSILLLRVRSKASVQRVCTPQVRQIDGNGRTLLPELIGNLSRAEARRTMVVFDGEKRFLAWETFQRFRHRVALAIFDDTNLWEEGRRFTSMLDAAGEAWFNTADAAYASFIRREERTLPEQLRQELRPLTLSARGQI